jgi:hypothetical protein
MKTANRPEITEERLEQIRKTISENPVVGRTRLSVVLSEIWDWRDASDRAKDMSRRDLLSSLEQAGRIDLPPRIRLARKPGDAKGIKHLVHDKMPIVKKFGELQLLNIEVVTSGEPHTYNSIHATQLWKDNGKEREIRQNVHLHLVN